MITNSNQVNFAKVLGREVQEESNEPTVRYTKVVLDPLKPRISCQNRLRLSS